MPLLYQVREHRLLDGQPFYPFIAQYRDLDEAVLAAMDAALARRWPAVVLAGDDGAVVARIAYDPITRSVTR